MRLFSYRFLILLSVLSQGDLASAHGAGLTKAKTDYILKCQGCHKADGTGMPPQTPDFHTHGALFMHAPEGRRYWVSVPGAANSPLTDSELANVLNYIASDIVEIEDHKSFTAEEVQQYRGAKMTDVYEVRRNLAAKLTKDTPKP